MSDGQFVLLTPVDVIIAKRDVERLKSKPEREKEAHYLELKDTGGNVFFSDVFNRF